MPDAAGEGWLAAVWDPIKKVARNRPGALVLVCSIVCSVVWWPAAVADPVRAPAASVGFSSAAGISAAGPSVAGSIPQHGGRPGTRAASGPRSSARKLGVVKSGVKSGAVTAGAVATGAVTAGAGKSHAARSRVGKSGPSQVIGNASRVSPKPGTSKVAASGFAKARLSRVALPGRGMRAARLAAHGPAAKSPTWEHTAGKSVLVASALPGLPDSMLAAAQPPMPAPVSSPVSSQQADPVPTSPEPDKADPAETYPIFMQGDKPALAAARGRTQVSYGVEQLIAAAIASHPTVAMKRLEHSAAAGGVQAAKLQFYPTPSVSLDSLHGKQATVFRLSQALWTGGRLTADLTAAELKEGRAELAVSDAELTLALRVVTLYQSFLLQSGRMESQRRGTEKLDQLVTMIERRVGSGVSAQIDLDLARSRLAQSRSDLIALTGSQRSVLGQLSQVTSRPLQAEDIIREVVGAPSNVAGGFSDSVQLTARDSSQSLLARALEASPALKLAAVDAQIAKNEVAQTRSALWPTVSLRAEHQEGSFAGSQAAGGRVYLSLQYTPGAGLAVVPLAAAAEVRAQASEQAALTVRRDVSDRVEIEWLDFQSASARVPELDLTRAGSRDVLESSVRLFVTGRRTWLDLLNSVRELMQTEQLEVDARATVVGSSYRLRLLGGESMWIHDGVNP
jgi:adhesin transport system outer membrane protein